jgi:hypothetical protein
MQPPSYLLILVHHLCTCQLHCRYLRFFAFPAYLNFSMILTFPAFSSSFCASSSGIGWWMRPQMRPLSLASGSRHDGHSVLCQPGGASPAQTVTVVEAACGAAVAISTRRISSWLSSRDFPASTKQNGIACLSSRTAARLRSYRPYRH